MRAALGVAHKGDDDVSVVKVEDSLGSIRREPSKLKEEGKLYAVASMPVLLLCRGQVGLEDFYKVLDVYRGLLPFLGTQLMLFGQFPEYLRNRSERQSSFLTWSND